MNEGPLPAVEGYFYVFYMISKNNLLPFTIIILHSAFTFLGSAQKSIPILIHFSTKRFYLESPNPLGFF